MVPRLTWRQGGAGAFPYSKMKSFGCCTWFQNAFSSVFFAPGVRKMRKVLLKGEVKLEREGWLAELLLTIRTDALCMHILCIPPGRHVSAEVGGRENFRTGEKKKDARSTKAAPIKNTIDRSTAAANRYRYDTRPSLSLIATISMYLLLLLSSDVSTSTFFGGDTQRGGGGAPFEVDRCGMHFQFSFGEKKLQSVCPFQWQKRKPAHPPALPSSIHPRRVSKTK